MVGGAVRNALIGMPVEEIDVATTAVPDEVVRRVSAAGFKPVPTGIEHGTVTVVIDKHPFEVTTLRQDVETYGRHAKVAFGRDWRADAERRDFTINALSATRDGTVYDYVGGLDDLDARRVRFIGDPPKRIAEDYLRILRFFRFHAAYGAGGHPDAEGLAACIAGRDGLGQLSRERVRMELMKLVVAQATRCRRSSPWPTPACCCGCSAASVISARSRTWPKSRRRSASRARSGAPARRARRHGGRGRRAAVAEAAADQQRARAAGLDGRGLAARSRRASASRRRARCSIGWGAALHRPRAAGLGALAGDRARPSLARAGKPAAALERADVSV